MSIVVSALDPAVERVVHRAWVADDAGEPLRCCLRDHRVGERVALVSVTPPGPLGAYVERGPVFVHADACHGPASAGYPDEWRTRTQIFRAYDEQGRICGGEIVEPGDQQEVIAERLLTQPGVAFVQSRNVVYGCYMLTMRCGDES